MKLAITNWLKKKFFEIDCNLFVKTEKNEDWKELKLSEVIEAYEEENIKNELMIAFKYNWSGNSFFSSGDFGKDFNKWYTEIYLKIQSK
jgi:hypothetical protein